MVAGSSPAADTKFKKRVIMKKKDAPELKKIFIKKEFYLGSKGLCDCINLLEMKNLIAQLIEQYGEEATIDFDSGHNNISETIIISELESDEDFEKRKEKIVNELKEKEKKLQATLKKIQKQIENQ